MATTEAADDAEAAAAAEESTGGRAPCGSSAAGDEAGARRGEAAAAGPEAPPRSAGLKGKMDATFKSSLFSLRSFGDKRTQLTHLFEWCMLYYAASMRQSDRMCVCVCACARV